MCWVVLEHDERAGEVLATQLFDGPNAAALACMEAQRRRDRNVDAWWVRVACLEVSSRVPLDAQLPHYFPAQRSRGPAHSRVA